MKRIGFLAALLTVALAGPATALAAGSHEIDVYGSDGGITAKFSSAKCVKGKSQESGRRAFFAEAVSTNGKYQLFVKVFGFDGFHEYQIEQGSIDPNPGVTFQEKTENGGGSEYSNRFVPSYPSPGFGAIAFRQGGRLLGVGYGPAMYSRDLSDAVFLTGVVECHYKKKKRSGKREPGSVRRPPTQPQQFLRPMVAVRPSPGG